MVNTQLHSVFVCVFVCIGDAGVGKTSLIARLTEGRFKSSVVSTVGLDFSTKTLRVGEDKVMFQLWDTAGQERSVSFNVYVMYCILLLVGILPELHLKKQKTNKNISPPHTLLASCPTVWPRFSIQLNVFLVALPKLR